MEPTQVTVSTNEAELLDLTPRQQLVKIQELTRQLELAKAKVEMLTDTIDELTSKQVDAVQGTNWQELERRFNLWKRNTDLKDSGPSDFAEWLDWAIVKLDPKYGAPATGNTPINTAPFWGYFTK